MTDPEVTALDEAEIEVVRAKATAMIRLWEASGGVPEADLSRDALALLTTLDATRAQLAEEQTAHATLRALWDARCGTIASVQARLEEAEGKLRHNVRAEEEFRTLTADVNADRERELFATEEKLAAVQARLTEAEGLLVESEAYVRCGACDIGRGRASVCERIYAFFSPRPEPACVCGHTKSQHSGHTAAWGEDMPTHCSQADGCRKYRPEPKRARTMLDDIIADGKPGEGLYGKTPCAACGDDLTKCCRECGREYACGGFHGCGRYWRKGTLKQTWPKCPGCLPAKEPRPEPVKGGGT